MKFSQYSESDVDYFTQAGNAEPEITGEPEITLSQCRICNDSIPQGDKLCARCFDLERAILTEPDLAVKILLTSANKLSAMKEVLR